jgi:hypothetical protein
MIEQVVLLTSALVCAALASLGVDALIVSIAVFGARLADRL